MTQEQFDRQPVAKGDKILVKYGYSSLTFTENIMGVDWIDGFYINSEERFIHHSLVIQYIPNEQTND